MYVCTHIQYSVHACVCTHTHTQSVCVCVCMCVCVDLKWVSQKFSGHQSKANPFFDTLYKADASTAVLTTNVLLYITEHCLWHNHGQRICLLAHTLTAKQILLTVCISFVYNHFYRNFRVFCLFVYFACSLSSQHCPNY